MVDLHASAREEGESLAHIDCLWRDEGQDVAEAMDLAWSIKVMQSDAVEWCATLILNLEFSIMERRRAFTRNAVYSSVFSCCRVLLPRAQRLG